MAGNHGNAIVISNREEWDSKLFEAQTNEKVVIVDFTASWCGPCKFMAPVFAELSEKHPEIIFLKVDVDDHEDISKEYDIRAMPTFVIIKEGVQVERLVGANKEKLVDAVESFAQQEVVAA